MNILIYSLNFTPEETGTGKYVGEMAAWLSSRGHKTEVICGLPHYPDWELHPNYSDGQSRREIFEGITVNRASHFIPHAAKVDTRARILMETSFTLSAARYWLPKLMGRAKPDVVIAVMPPMQICAWPLIYSWIRRVPWVLHVQDLQVDAALRLEMLSSGISGRLLYSLERFFLRMATRVSTITEPMQRRIISKGTDSARTWLFPNWANISQVRPTNRDNEFRRALNIGPDTCIVLYSGNMGKKQGLDTVLKAAKELKARKDIVFLLVGSGAARLELERLSDSLSLDNVRFLPLQPAERLSDMLAAGDIHLVVQRRGAADLVMPSKLTNILASGRPSVATAEPGTALFDVVNDHRTGVATPPEDPMALAAALIKLADDDGLRAQLGASARRYAEQHLDRDSILSRFEDHLFTLTVKESHE